MARKPKPKGSSKPKGFGFGAAGARTSAPMGFVGEELPEERNDFDVVGVTTPPVVMKAPSEPLIRLANVGSLGVGMLVHLLSEKKSPLTPVLAINLFDILARQLSTTYREKVQLGTWNIGVTP